MQVITTRQFEKDAQKELDKKLRLQLADIIEQLQQSDHLMEIPHMKKMKGYTNAYRIRFGDYVSVFFLKIIRSYLAG